MKDLDLLARAEQYLVAGEADEAFDILAKFKLSEREFEAFFSAVELQYTIEQYLLAYRQSVNHRLTIRRKRSKVRKTLHLIIDQLRKSNIYRERVPGELYLNQTSSLRLKREDVTTRFTNRPLMIYANRVLVKEVLDEQDVTVRIIGRRTNLKLVLNKRGKLLSKMRGEDNHRVFPFNVETGPFALHIQIDPNGNIKHNPN